ncbi:hypothetical protein DL237_01660 [Pseudooceanicola sediminis]|uniref:Uncharacterized protein n=1 Tax=Pseudooceanicola sediminis TaxID=2211117 RepID=A0A399J5T0_9RHOB|nr:hypothetical protein [Pseudooceanicola sediminis]KAA2316802.1 hypothetical protein E0K93_00260 [Puniceibacterium sp. HSS470]RII40741.1 hypothetical protein DL237_01660 [Pseudooceanicola sediminis]
MKGDATDPKALIREAYRIEGIDDPECRSVLMDWALSLDDGQDQKAALEALMEQYGRHAPDHPMTALLKDGLRSLTPMGRRGGSRGRTPH